MTDQVNTELQELKKKADKLGINYSPIIGVSALKERIEQKLKEGITEEPKKETPSEIRKRLKARTALKRVKITCMNPQKNGYTGDFFIVCNKYIGNIKRFVPFNTPWHVEEVLLDFIKSKKYVTRTTTSDRSGKIIIDSRSYPEYQIQELPMLTSEELKKLAQMQKVKAELESESLV